MKYLLRVAGILLLLAFAGPAADQDVKPFKWLEGSWTMKTKRGMIKETWKPGTDTTLQGESRMLYPGGEEKLLETLTLLYAEGNYYYVSKVNGQNNNEAVSFRITSYHEQGFVAENPGHDFPKRISYTLVGKDSVHAYIDGGASMPAKRSDFYYSRLKE